MSSISAASVSSDTPWLDVLASRQLMSWLAEQRISLAFTTYQTGKLFVVGLQPDERLSLFERTFNRCLGLWCDGQPSRQSAFGRTTFDLTICKFFAA